MEPFANIHGGDTRERKRIYNMKPHYLLLSIIAAIPSIANAEPPKLELPTIPAPYINAWMVADSAQSTSSRYFDDRVFSRNYDDYQDLRSYLGWICGESTTARSVTATCGVGSTEDRNAQLWVGAGDWANPKNTTGITPDPVDTILKVTLKP